jgi:hypothetical protein
MSSGSSATTVVGPHLRFKLSFHQRRSELTVAPEPRRNESPAGAVARPAPDELALAGASGVLKTKTNLVLFGVQLGSWSIS